MEYEVIPMLIRIFKNRGRDFRYLNLLTALQQVAQQKYPDAFRRFDWSNVRIHTFGRQGDDVVVVFYKFPEPFQFNLAAYGAVVIQGEEVHYYTCELTYEGDYVLGSVNEFDKHERYGCFSKMSPEQFLARVCNRQKFRLRVSFFRWKSLRLKIVCSYYQLLEKTQIFIYDLFGIL